MRITETEMGTIVNSDNSYLGNQDLERLFLVSVDQLMKVMNFRPTEEFDPLKNSRIWQNMNNGDLVLVRAELRFPGDAFSDERSNLDRRPNKPISFWFFCAQEFEVTPELSSKFDSWFPAKPGIFSEHGWSLFPPSVIIDTEESYSLREIFPREVFAHLTPASPTGGLAGASDPVSDRSNELADSLRLIPHGKVGWRDYEKLMREILDFLFCPPLEEVASQNRTESGVNIRDFILPNNATAGFWNSVKTRYGADYVVFEAKNYADEVGKTEVLQLANYLNRYGTGMFGILLTRNGVDAGGQETIRMQWIAYDKMMLVITDSDIITMLTKKPVEDPGSVIQQMIDKFRLAL